MINLLGMIDRALFGIGILLIIAKVFGFVAWPWKWVLFPLVLFVIVSFLKAREIRKEHGIE